jgi:hypothetical protein
LSDGETLRLVAGASRRARQRSNVGELDVGVGGDRLRHASEDQRECGIVIATAHQGHSFALEAADFSVGKNRFESVADFDARAMILNDVEDEHSAVGALASDAPLLEQIDGVALDVAAFERIDSDESDLRVGLGVELLGDTGYLRRRIRVQDVRKIVDVIGGLELRDRLRERNETQDNDEQSSEQPLRADGHCNGLYGSNSITV